MGRIEQIKVIIVYFITIGHDDDWNDDQIRGFLDVFVNLYPLLLERLRDRAWSGVISA